MVTPLVQEYEWTRELISLCDWYPSAKPMAVIAPHPDDETLAAGGIIASQRARGVDVKIVAITDGENAYPGQEHLGDLRRQEQNAAVARLDVAGEKIIRFGLPDGGVASQEQELVERLSSIVSANTHLLAPWRGDFHPDHEACGRAAEVVACSTGATLTRYLFWTWHYGTVASVNGLSLRRFPLTNELLLRKIEAIRCYRSQLEREDGKPILPELLLAPAKRAFEAFVIA